VLPILREVTAALGFVPPPVITEVAHALGMPRGQVEGVVGFYSFLSSEPKGLFRVLFSDNVTDVMAGSVELRQRLLDAFDLQLGETSRDGLLSVGTTSCTGLCDQGPALLVNGHAIASLTPARIGAIDALIRGRVPLEQWPSNLFEIHSHVERRDLLLSTVLAPGDGIDAAIATPTPITSRAFYSVCFDGRTRMTGQRTLSSTFCATEPMSNRSSPVRPCVPRTA
jgi:[NiFe] hydrogenase diaphorase moiety large subunit